MDPDETAIAVARVRSWSKARRRRANLALMDGPPLFDLEVASACNVVCTFCPRDEMARPKKLMDDVTFAAIESFLPLNAVAMISGLGDALLNPRLEVMIARLAARGVAACVITNGIRLTPKRQATLVASGVSELQISVHGLDEATVSSVVPEGANPVAVRANLEHLAGAHFGKPGGLRVRVNFVETPENAHARADVQAWAEGLGFRFFYRRQHTRGGLIGEARDAGVCSGCGIFANVTFITVEGDIMPCVNDVRGEGRFANVRDVSWDDVLAWKRDVIGGDRWFPPCHSCDDDYRWVLLEQGGLEER